MLDSIFPLQCLAIAGLLALAVYRGNFFPLLLVAVYAAFFILSFGIEPDGFLKLNMEDNDRIWIASGLSTALAVIGLSSKRRLYIDLFSLLMILAIMNYCLILFANIFLAASAFAYGIVEHIYLVFYILLGVADILVMIGVINGSNDDRVYSGLIDAFDNVFQRVFARVESPQTIHRKPGQTQTQKGNSING